MAISRQTKESQVSEFGELLKAAKMTVFADYTGVSVGELQELRRSARESNVVIKVIKNRLVRVSLQQQESLKGVDTSLLTGHLLYAISAEDEVAPAQILAQFAKTHPQLQLIGGLDSLAAKMLSTATVKSLASLPSKDQLRGMLVSTIAAPLTQLMGVISGAQRGFVQVLAQKADKANLN